MSKFSPVTKHKEGTTYGYAFACPGCNEVHVIPTDPTEKIHWEFNGDLDKPTLKPSILRYARNDAPRCHSFVREGKIQFLRDCTHGLAGKTVELPEWEGWFPQRAGTNDLH